MQQIGYSLVDASGQEVAFWGDDFRQCAGVPNIVPLPSGDVVHCANVGDVLHAVVVDMVPTEKTRTIQRVMTGEDEQGNAIETVGEEVETYIEDVPHYSQGAAYKLVERWGTYSDVDAVSVDPVTGRVIVERKVPSHAVDAERDRRLAVVNFQGHAFKVADDFRADIAVAALIASSDPTATFEWIAADNTRVPMDAATTRAFSKAVSEWRTGHFIAARALKDATPIPTDFTADAYWPS